MLLELAVRDLGVISELSILLGPGLTAITGETGAGKTMLVGAIDLLLGGRADPHRVRSGCAEAVVEGRFEIDGEERVLRRVVPADGRSRAYVDGRLAAAAELADLGSRALDLHGQHAHQALLATATQRAALDRFGAVDLGPLLAARATVAAISDRLSGLGGDARARAHEVDLLRFQVAELSEAGLDDPEEDELLEAEEDRLAAATAHVDAAAAALRLLRDDEGATDSLGAAIAALDGRRPFEELVRQLRDVTAQVDDAISVLRAEHESIEEDPARLEVVRARRDLLHRLTRKYGDSLREVIDFRDDAVARLADLEAHDEVHAAVERELAAARSVVETEEAAVGALRRAAAPRLAAAVEVHLKELAMANAQVSIDVDGRCGDEVAFLLAANRGVGFQPLARVASGGELARSMLALRLVLSAGPPTQVFDEVDAGVGGEAALAVGRLLAQLSADRQVLVVTHLAQVAAYADVQVRIRKAERGSLTLTTAEALGPEDRVVELSRMLSGTPESTTMRTAAEELLASTRTRPQPSRPAGGRARRKRTA